METPQLHRYLGMPPAAPLPVVPPSAKATPFLAEFRVPPAPAARRPSRPARRWIAWRRDKA